MAKELREKVGTLIRSIEKLNEFDKIDAVERFMRNEFGLMEASQHITFNNLVQVHSRASTIMRDLPSDLALNGKSIRDYPEISRTICFFQATYEHMRQEKMTPYLLSFGPPKRNRS